tara:strand:+ start:144 stop:632 length:489 start_codon:yes stop_codon:yes gene_type:complete
MSKTFEGKPCRTCGNTERYFSGNKPCVMCVKKNSQERLKNGKQKSHTKSNSEYIREYNKKRYHSLSEEQKQAQNRRMHIRTYGIQPEDYDKMLTEQNGVCACCGEKETNPKKKHLSIDHCHKTGEVRALLCDRCNRGIGALNDELDILRKAVLYLERYQSQS